MSASLARGLLVLSFPAWMLAAHGCDEQGTVPGETGADTSTNGTDTATTSVQDSATATDTTPPEDVATTTTAPTDTSVTTAPSDTTTTPVDVLDDATAPDTSDATEPIDTTPVDTAIVLPLERPPIVATHATGFSGWTMAPQAETTRCVVKRLDNAGVLWVSQIRTELAKGSHHMIIYKSEETTERATPFECDPFVETLTGKTVPLMITQIRNETLAFPNGVAFRFEPNQMVRLEAHFLNYFPEDIEASGTVYFDGIAEADVVSEANLLFYGTPDIDIPKGQSVTTPWYFLDVMPGSRLFALTGHTHQYGTNVEIGYASSLGDEGTSIYPPEGEDYDWEEPPVSYFDPHIVFGSPDRKGLRYRCSWTNTSNKNVSFGESAQAEMCFMWGYYFPSQGYRVCISPGSLGGGLFGDQVCCGGADESPVCDLVRQWAQ